MFLSRFAGLLLALALTGSVVQAEDTRTCVLRVDFVGEEAAELTLELSTEGGEKRRLRVSAQDRIEIELPVDSRWRVATTDPAFWFAGKILEAGTAEVTTLKVYPAGVVRGALRAPRGSTLPREAILRFAQPPSARRAEPSGETTCEIVEGEIRCKLPRGRADLRLDIPTFVPIYRWSVEIRPEADLGKLSLRRGASVAGWVEAATPGISLAETRLELIEDIATLSPAVGTSRSALRRYETVADERGFFQLGGVEGGRFHLVARHPRLAASRLTGLELVEAEESFVDSLVLTAGAQVELRLDPPTDPFHGQWSLDVLVLGAREDEPELETPVSVEGTWTAQGLTPGRYRVEVRDSRGSRWLGEEIEVFEGPNIVELEAPFERLEGLLLLDGEPVDGAAVTLREHRGNMKVETVSREGGHFYVFLGQDRLWNVEVTHRAERISAHFPRVEVPERRRTDRWPKKTFEIPDTRLFGDLVDPSGRPLWDPITVEADALEDPGPTDPFARAARGRFEIRGLAAGRHLVSASFNESATKKRGGSQPVEVTIPVDGEVGPLRLVVEESRRLAGQVHRGDGHGFHGALVFAEVEGRSGQPLTTNLPQATSDIDGLFDLDVPTAARRLHLTVLAPGHALTLTSFEIDSGAPLLIPLESEAGALRITWQDPEDSWALDLRRHTFLVRERPIPGALLRLWARLHDEAPAAEKPSLFLPKLPAGEYRACFNIPELGPFLLSNSPIPPSLLERACGDAGFLPPNGQLELRVPRRALEARLGDSS